MAFSTHFRTINFFVAVIITFARAGNCAKERIIRYVHESSDRKNALKFHGFIGMDSVHILNLELVYLVHVKGSKKAGEVSFQQLEMPGGPQRIIHDF